MIRKHANDRCRPTNTSVVYSTKMPFVQFQPSPELNAPNKTTMQSWWRRRQPGQRMTLTNVIRRRRIRPTLQQVIVHNLLNTHTKTRLLWLYMWMWMWMRTGWNSVQWKLHNARSFENHSTFLSAEQVCVRVIFTPSIHFISLEYNMLANGLSHILILSQRWSVKLCKRVIVL